MRITKDNPITLIAKYIKENPDCIIEYVNQDEFIVYKKSKRKFIQENGSGWDWDVSDKIGSDGYIPNIALIFHYCVKKCIDISNITIKSV